MNDSAVMHLPLAFLLTACGSHKSGGRSIERWSFLPVGEFKHVSPKQKDTSHIEFKAGSVELRFSNRRSGDTLFFAVLSGIRVGASGSDESQDLAPGEGYLLSRAGLRDSVYFEAGAASFRGTATDVFMSGTVRVRPRDTTFKVFPPTGGATWRMALTSRDTVP
jgi:hypothetical protein